MTFLGLRLIPGVWMYGIELFQENLYSQQRQAKCRRLESAGPSSGMHQGLSCSWSETRTSGKNSILMIVVCNFLLTQENLKECSSTIAQICWVSGCSSSPLFCLHKFLRPLHFILLVQSQHQTFPLCFYAARYCHLL